MEEKITCIIVDDEARARHTLASLITEYCPEVEIIDQCDNVPAAVISINKSKPNVVFLDVEMPEYSGFELLDFFRDIDFEIIFVTAYAEYAIRAFEVSAIDYILKPVQIDNLQAAVKKALTKKKNSNIQQRLELLKIAHQGEQITKIALPMGDGLLFINIADLVVLEADGSYTTVYMNDGSKIVVSKKLKFFEDLLENRTGFYRPHRSFIININFIKKYIRGESILIMDNNVQVSVSREKKSEFDTLLKQLRLTF